MTNQPSRPSRPNPSGPPVQRLTVLYDPDCRLCAFVRNWLTKQRQLVPLEPVPVGSDEARSRFPDLDHTSTRREITVVGDAGQVYRGEAAWLVCLWALAEYRPVSHRLSTRAGAPFARAAVLAAAKYREAQWGLGSTSPGTSRGSSPGRQTAWAPIVDAGGAGASRGTSTAAGTARATGTGPDTGPRPDTGPGTGACADGCDAPR
jgi:predicted DCC family thiol-disulfide oxidoreductase YuxK